MKNMKKFTVAILAIALVAVGTIFVIAQTSEKPFEGKRNFGKQKRHGKFGRRGDHMGRLFRHLDLTDEQKAQLMQIRQTSRETMKPLRQQMRQIRQQTADLGTNGVYDDAQVQALAGQQAEIARQLFVEKQKVKAQMFAVLTVEQKAKLAELKEQFKQKRQERRAWRQQQNTEKSEQ